MNNLNFVISTLGQIVLLLNVVFCWIGKPAFKKRFRFFRYYLLLALLVQIPAKVLALQSMNNLPLLHLYTLLEFLFLSLFYRDLLSQSARDSRNFVFFTAIVCGLIVLNSLLWQPLTRFNSNAKTLTQLLYIGYAVYYFFLYQSKETTPFVRAANLLNSGILVYYAASLFIFMFSNVLLELNAFHHIFWIVNSLLYFGLQLLIFYWLWRIIFRPPTFT